MSCSCSEDTGILGLESFQKLYPCPVVTTKQSFETNMTGMWWFEKMPGNALPCAQEEPLNRGDSLPSNENAAGDALRLLWLGHKR